MSSDEIKYNWRNHDTKTGRMEIRIGDETKNKLDKLVKKEHTDRTKVIERLINKEFDGKKSISESTIEPLSDNAKIVIRNLLEYEIKNLSGSSSGSDWLEVVKANQEEFKKFT